MQHKLKTTLFFTFSLSFLFTTILFAQSSQSPTQRWEYFTMQSCEGGGLNKYGDEGWELVAAVHKDTSNCPYYTFKKMKPADAPKYVDPQAPLPPKADAPTCNLPLTQAPTIRGLRLGMTVEELIELFPGANPNELKGKAEQAKGEPALGYLNFDFPGSQHKDRLEGQSLYINLFDGKVTSFRISYSFTNHSRTGQIFSSEQFLDKLIGVFDLPAKEYWQQSSGNINLQCRGFRVNGYVGSNLGVSVFDTSKAPEEKTKQRRDEALAQKRAEFKP
jgi:hypothetical protein